MALNPAGGHGSLSVVSVVYQVEAPASGRSLVQRTECGVSERDRETSTVKRPWLTRVCGATKKGHSLIDSPNIEARNRNMQQKYRKSKVCCFIFSSHR